MTETPGRFALIRAEAGRIGRFGLRIARAIVRDIRLAGLDYRAMGLVYTSLLALVPLLAVSFSVLKAFGADAQLEPLLQELLEPLGDKSDVVAERILDSVKRLRVGVLGFVGVLFLFVTTVSLLEKIEESFNHIWRTRVSRRPLRRLSDYLSFILVGPMLVFSAFGGMSGLIEQRAVTRTFSTDVVQWVHLALPFLFVVLAFTFVYLYIPNTRVRPRPALIGGLIAAVLWKTAGWLFSVFFAGSAQYHAVYSSFAILVLFMLWLHVSWMILLVGVEVSFYVQHPSYLRFRGPVRFSARQQERIGLSLFLAIARDFLEGRPTPMAATLADRFDLPEDSLRDLLQMLAEAGLLIAIDASTGHFLPARDLSTLPIGQVLDALRSGPDADPREGDEPDPAVAALVNELDQSRDLTLAGRTVLNVLQSR